MSQRRIAQNQHLMFVTTCTKDREPIFADGAYARAAIECLYRIQQKYPFFLYAFVIMPDHSHFLMNVPAHGSISKILYAFKRGVCFDVGKSMWQPRYYVKHVTNPGRIFEYIHMNPVRQNLCERTEEYQWSSASGRWDVSELPLM